MKVFGKIMALVLFVSLMGCDASSDQFLNLSAEQANKLCPMKVDDYTTLQQVTYGNGIFVYNYRLSPSVVSDALMNEVSDATLKENILNTLKNNNSSDVVKFKEVCKKRGCKIIYHYVYEDQVKDIVIEANEL